jgi:hypothetical protein
LKGNAFMQSFVIQHPDTSVSDVSPEVRIYQIRINPLARAQRHIDATAAEIYSQICYHIEDLAGWVQVQASVGVIARLQTAGLVQVRVENGMPDNPYIPASEPANGNPDRGL